MEALVFIIFGLGLAAIVEGWLAFWARHDRIAALRAECYHHWETIEQRVATDSRGRGGFSQDKCSRCGAQRPTPDA